MTSSIVSIATPIRRVLLSLSKLALKLLSSGISFLHGSHQLAQKLMINISLNSISFNDTLPPFSIIKGRSIADLLSVSVICGSPDEFIKILVPMPTIKAKEINTMIGNFFI